MADYIKPKKIVIKRKKSDDPGDDEMAFQEIQKAIAENRNPRYFCLRGII